MAYVQDEQSYLNAVEAPTPQAAKPFSSTRWQIRGAATLNKQKECLLQVLVRDNNVDQALRVLKRKMQREGVLREMKRRRFYEKPSEKMAREKKRSNQ